jgi:hypothetical protein
MLGQSAGRLAIATKSSAAYQDFVRFKILAVEGLNRAIATFSKENADAILFASIAISNQESNW